MISNYPNNKNWSNKGKTENQFIQNCEEIYIVKPGSWKISKKKIAEKQDLARFRK